MSVVARFLVIILAYVLACIAASAVFTIGALSPHWGELMSSGLPPEAVWAMVAVGTPIIGAAGNEHPALRKNQFPGDGEKCRRNHEGD